MARARLGDLKAQIDAKNKPPVFEFFDDGQSSNGNWSPLGTTSFTAHVGQAASPLGIADVHGNATAIDPPESSWGVKGVLKTYIAIGGSWPLNRMAGFAQGQGAEAEFLFEPEPGYQVTGRFHWTLVGECGYVGSVSCDAAAVLSLEGNPILWGPGPNNAPISQTLCPQDEFTLPKMAKLDIPRFLLQTYENSAGAANAKIITKVEFRPTRIVEIATNEVIYPQP